MPCACVPAMLLSCVRLFASPWTAARLAHLSMGILLASILAWTVTPSSRESSRPKDQTHVSCTGRQFLYHQHPLGSPYNATHFIIMTYKIKTTSVCVYVKIAQSCPTL